MAHLWQVRSTQLNAYKTQSFKDWAQNSANSQIPALVADATAGHFGGYKIDVRALAGKNAICYCAVDNISGQKHTFHIRISPTWTGFPSRAQTFFIIGNPDGSYNQGFLIRFTTAGKVEVTCLDKSNNTRVGVLTTATLSCTSGTPVDVYVSIDNTITTGAVKVYWNQHGAAATLQHTDNASTAITRDRMATTGICIGFGDQGLSDFYLVEANIWNTIEDPTALGIRTDFITATAFEGAAWETVTAAQLESGVSKLQGGTTVTGALVVPSQSNTAYGVTFGAAGLTGTNRGYTFWQSVPAADIESGMSYLQDGTTVTGTLVTGTDPATTDVREGVSWINGSGVTVTGSLVVPTTYTGTASLVNFAQIKENLRYILSQANTTTADFDLSSGLLGDKRVRRIATRHPGKLPMAPAEYPYVSMFVDAKDIDVKDIAATQKNAKRMHTIRLKIVGGVVNNTIKGDPKLDKADDDCERLMENIEEVIRRNPTLGNVCLWHTPSGVTYHNRAFDEESALRVGILSLDIAVMT